MHPFSKRLASVVGLVAIVAMLMLGSCRQSPSSTGDTDDARAPSTGLVETSVLADATTLPAAATSTPSNVITELAFASVLTGDMEIYVGGADGSGRQQLTHSPWPHTVYGVDDPVWSPDGQQIAFTSSRITTLEPTNDIFLMNADGSNQRNLTNLPGHDLEPAWAPDGRQIVFVHHPLGGMSTPGPSCPSGATCVVPTPDYDALYAHIHVVNADGSGERALTTGPGSDAEPSWSPDGRHIVYTHADVNGDFSIYLMNADGSGQRSLLPGVRASEPRWSPDGQRIAYVALISGQPGTAEIHVVNVDGSNDRAISAPGVVDYHPAWSPNGQRIVFVSERTGNDEVYVMDADGSNVRQITDFGVPEWPPSWSPDGRWVAVTPQLYTGSNANTHKLIVVNIDSDQRQPVADFVTSSGPPAWRPIA